MIDIAFGVALVLSILAFGEMLLRKHQKKSIDDWLEAATLHLDYALQESTSWLENLLKLKRGWVLAGSALALF